MTKKTEETVVVTNTSNNQGTLYGIIIGLLMVIAVGGFFLGMKLGENNAPAVNLATNNGGGETGQIAEDITITVYDDARCTNCQTSAIIESLKNLPVLASAKFIIKDFSDSGVEQFLIDNKQSIDLLPAAVFSTNAVGPTLGENLLKLPDESYFLRLADGNQVPGFDPFLERGPNGFTIADSDTLESVKATAYLKGNENAKITWIEYTDVNCGYCKKMETDGTANTVLAAFPNELNKASSNYVGVGGAATQTAAEILECSGKIGGADVFNNMISKVLSDGDNSEATMLAMATEQGLDSRAVKACLDAGETKNIVAEKFSIGAEDFGITGTPGNVLINNETGEYEIVSGAYPADKFIETVNKLLGNS